MVYDCLFSLFDEFLVLSFVLLTIRYMFVSSAVFVAEPRICPLFYWFNVLCVCVLSAFFAEPRSCPLLYSFVDLLFRACN